MQGSSKSKGKKLTMGLLGGGSYYEVEPFPLEAEMACFHPDDERRANLRSWNGIGNTKPKYSINVYVNICGKYSYNCNFQKICMKNAYLMLQTILPRLISFSG